MRCVVLLLVCVAGCAGPTGETTAIVLEVEVTETCDGGCANALMPPRASELCGRVSPEFAGGAEKVKVVTELPPEQIEALVELQYRVVDSAGKGHDFVLAQGERAVVRAIGEDLELYSVGADGALALRAAADGGTVSLDGDSVVARYGDADREV